MTNHIALIINPDGSFEVRRQNCGSVHQLAWHTDLCTCLQMAATIAGHQLVIPITEACK